jgi:hypothetical protein
MVASAFGFACTDDGTVVDNLLIPFGTPAIAALDFARTFCQRYAIQLTLQAPMVCVPELLPPPSEPL